MKKFFKSKRDCKASKKILKLERKSLKYPQKFLGLGEKPLLKKNSLRVENTAKTSKTNYFGATRKFLKVIGLPKEIKGRKTLLGGLQILF